MKLNNIFQPLIMVLSFLVFAACTEKQADENQAETPKKKPKKLGSTIETFFPGFRDVDVIIDSIKIHAVVGGSGEPLLLLHGAPESHVVWRD